MALRAVEHIFTGTTTTYDAYDSTKTTLGLLIQQRTGVTSADKFAGPMPISMARPMESSTAIPVIYPHVIPFSSTIDWIFLADNATAAASRRVVLYEYNKVTGEFYWKGFITCTLPTAGAATIRGFRASRELYTTGTAAASGTAVTGTSTTWDASRMTVGSRIGFGSSDPTQISSWYQISSVDSDTGITLTTDAGTVVDGAYVIEDLKMMMTITNTTATLGGLFLIQGLNYDTFAVAGTTVPAATTVDRIRACYWLADASTVTNTISCGLAIEDRTSWTEQNIYVIDGTTTTNRVYKYNIRAALTLASGKSTDAWILTTGAQTPTGTCSQVNNGRVGNLGHGPGSGVDSLYFVTTTRVYRALLTNITSGNTTWHSDAMVEIPPGGTSTYPATSALGSVEIAGTIDRLVVMSSGTAGARSYVTKYNTVSDPFDHIFLVDDKQYDQASADSDSAPHPAISALPISVWSEGGIAYLCRHSTSATLNQLYAVPLSAHWTYANENDNNQRLITPELVTSNASQYLRAYVNYERLRGSFTFGVPPETYRIYYRTSGISDNSGNWEVLDDTGNLEGIGSAASIQFMFEFRILGPFCIPARLFSVGLIYEDNTTDSHYQPSVAHSSTTNKQFAWRFSTAFGSTVPTLRIRLYNAVTGGLLDNDDSVTQAGTWEKSTNDGGAWGAYDTSDLTNDTTYIRFTPASLGDNIKVRALLTQD